MAKTKSKKKSGSKGSKGSEPKGQNRGSKNLSSGNQSIDKMIEEILVAIQTGGDGKSILAPLVQRWEELKATAHIGDISYVRQIDAKIKQLEAILNTGGPVLRGLAGQIALPSALPPTAAGGVAVTAPGIEDDVKFQPQELEELRRFEQRCHEHGGGHSPFDTYPQARVQSGPPGSGPSHHHGPGFQPTFQNPADHPSHHPSGGLPPQHHPSQGHPPSHHPSGGFQHHPSGHGPAHRGGPPQAFQPTFQNPAERPPVDVAAPPLHPQYPSQQPPLQQHQQQQHQQAPPQDYYPPPSHHPSGGGLPPQHHPSGGLSHQPSGGLQPPSHHPSGGGLPPQHHPSGGLSHHPSGGLVPPPSFGSGQGLEPPSPVPPPSNGYFHQQGLAPPAPGGYY